MARPISGWDLLLLRVELAFQDSSVWVGARQIGLVVLPPRPRQGEERLLEEVTLRVVFWVMRAVAGPQALGIPLGIQSWF